MCRDIGRDLKGKILINITVVHRAFLDMLQKKGKKGENVFCFITKRL